MTNTQILQEDGFMNVSENNHWHDYELLDSGNGQKLERFGEYIFIRPESQALWQPMLPESQWDEAHGIFEATQSMEKAIWHLSPTVPKRWKIHYKDIQMWVEPTPFRHFGVFPEQANHWEWMSELIVQSQRPIKVLNLFGYTGIASLFAAQSGATVTHVDASKKSITWAKENQLLSGLSEKPIRWIVDDALAFVQREFRRGVKYQGIIIDPPKFGRGPKGEIWKFEEMMPELLHSCNKILDNPLFILVTVYAVRLSSLSLHYTIADYFPNYKGNITSGELTLTEKSGQRILSPAMYSRWSATK